MFSRSSKIRSAAQHLPGFLSGFSFSAITNQSNDRIIAAVSQSCRPAVKDASAALSGLT
jgi:hypothetical protein